MMAVLIQCVSAPQRWPAYERKTEDRIFLLQQGIGNGLASGELTPNEAQNLLAKLENIRREYTVLRERSTTAEEWAPLLGRLDDLEREVNKARAQPSRIDETRIEDRMIVLQRRIDEGMHGRKIDARPGKGFSIKIGYHPKGIFATAKRPTPHPRGKSRDFGSS